MELHTSNFEVRCCPRRDFTLPPGYRDRVSALGQHGSEHLTNLTDVIFGQSQRWRHGEAVADWAARYAKPVRVIDPGVGSGRFLLEAGRRFPHALLCGVELDPVPAILARANLAVSGLQDRSRIAVDDYRSFQTGPVNGKTLFIGNPPYVRHHLLGGRWKRWRAAGWTLSA